MEKLWEFRYQAPKPPEGAPVKISRSGFERMLLDQLNDKNCDHVDALWELARFYAESQQHEKAVLYLRQVLDLQPDPESKAATILAMGQSAEQVRDYPAAIKYYKEAFALEPTVTRTWYLIHNNLGFSMNTLGHFQEGEEYCRKAIQIDGMRSNAFKNLGISLEAQGQFQEAARCYVQATRVNATDRRSYDLLQKLLKADPKLQAEFRVEAECCRKAVEFVQDQGE